MRRIDLGWWYRFGGAIQVLLNMLPSAPPLNVHVAALTTTDWLNTALSADVVPLSTSLNAALQLRAALNALNAQFTDANLVQGAAVAVPQHLVGNVIRAAYQFDTIFQAELAQFDTYHVSRKGAYSTPILIFSAEQTLIGDDIRQLVPEPALVEIKEWGRCFAFELSTASGFHILRAVELVILNYLHRFASEKKPNRTWSAYIAALNDAGADGKVTAALDQIRDLHRNPLMHPEDTLTLPEADALFGLAKAAIVAIVRDVQRRLAEPAKATAAQTHEV
jgi:hypothetical protein